MPLESQGSLMLLALRFRLQRKRHRGSVQCSILLAQPGLDLLKQCFDLVTRNYGIVTADIDERGEETHRPGELRHPFWVKLHSDPPANSTCFLKGLDDAIRGRGNHFQTRSQRFHRLVMHGQDRIQIGPIQRPSPSYRYRQAAVWRG